MSGRKKIYFYRHETKETIIDIYEAESWNDYLFIKVGNPGSVTQEQIDQVSRVVESLDLEYKQVVVMPAGLDLEFYGVELEE